MRRTFMLAAFLMAFMSSLFARSFFNTYSAAYNVNLADPDHYYTGTDDGEFSDGMGAGYSNRTLVAQVGFADTSQPVTIDITFNNTSWMYQSASQPNLKRPFGLDVIVRERYYYSLCNASVDNGNTDYTVEVHHLGIQSGGDQSMSITLTYDNATNGSVRKRGGELPDGPGGRHSWCTRIRHDLIGAWVELVLVLPEIDPYDTSYTVGSADDYYASFDITVSGGASGAYHCEFTGWYDDPRDEEINFTLNVVPTANSSAINFDTSPGIDSGASGLPIGRYYYSTTKSTTAEDRNYFAFCSSSPVPDGRQGPFTLIRNGTYGGEGNSIEYEVGLQSSELSKGVQWFDGDDAMIDGDTEPENVFYSSRRQDMQDIGGASIYQRYDEGEILFRLAPSADTDSLNAGVYTSNIYFHVVVEI